MTPREKLCLRAASDIHEMLGSPPRSPCERLPTETWRKCQSLLRKLDLAESCGWPRAAGRLLRDLRASIRLLTAETAEVRDRLDAAAAPIKHASLRDIYADLLALHQEFDDVSIDRKARTISVTTEPIVLEDLYLGPFKIELEWSDLPDGHPHNYRVIALEPDPAATNESVTHPHVQDEAVCEGDATPSLRSAQQQGRLLDFFFVVANLLRTYNPESPFVSIREWRGVSCVDCGYSTTDDDRYYCEHCEAAVCSDCYFNCGQCGGPHCRDCVTCCESCDEFQCGLCMTRCTKCRAEACRGCLGDNQTCEECQEQDQNQHEQIPQTTADQLGGPHAPLQPDRLGQAAVPARSG